MKEIFTKNEIYTNLKERLTNPFIFSFAVSWLFWNWPITIGLIWYSASNIKDLDVASYTELINKNADGWRNYGYPLLFAAAYTILLPLLKWGIDWVNAFFARKNQDSVLKVAKTGYIPTLKFIELKESYDNQINALSEAIKNESKIQVELGNIRAHNTALNTEINTLKNTISFQASNLDNLKMNGHLLKLTGNWSVIMEVNGEFRDLVWKIEDTIITVVGNNYDVPRKFIITSYVCNPLSKDTCFEMAGIFNDKISDSRNTYTNLQWNKDFTNLKSKGQPVNRDGFLELTKMI